MKAADESILRRWKWRTVCRALQLVWRGAPGWTLTGLLLTPVQALLTTLPLYVGKLAVDAVVAGLRAPDRSAAVRPVLFYVALQAAVSFAGTPVTSLAGLARDIQTACVTDYIAGVVQAKSVDVDLEYYENPQYHDTLRRAQTQATYRPSSIVTNLVSAGQSAISLLALVGLLISLSWLVALVLFLSTLPAVFVRIRYSGRMYGWQRRRTATERLSSYYDSLLSGDASAKEIRLFGLAQLLLERARELRARLRRERLAIQGRSSFADALAQLGATAATYGSYAYAALQTLSGRISLGGLTMYFGAFQRASGQLQSMLMSIAGLYESSLFLSDLDEFLDLERRVREPADPVPAPVPMQTGIRFEAVSFAYPHSAKRVLREIDLRLAPGEMIALVGENGSGKTTLAKLLCRLYDPTEGRILLDGTDLRDFSTADLRRQISVIFQDYQRYQLSARENIWLGNVAAPANSERIRDAARHAGADTVICDLPEGYETTLGRTFEGGVELSVGQWQKVALARAFMRDAQIIVLDEPTSAMDAKAEYEFFRDFRLLAAGRATVLVSHRFSTVRMADRIYVLEHGGIVESGSHDELMRLNGKYAQLFEMQAQHYR